MAQLIGLVGEFNPETEKITTYLERVTVFMDANDVKDEKKAAVLLSVIGKTNYALLEGLVAPKLPREKTYAELVAALKKHYEPTPVLIAERFHFYKRSQGLTESIADFAAGLRKLAIRCEFGDFLEEALRDRLVCGLRSEAIQKRLLSEKDLTLARTVELSQGMEAADRRTKEMKGTDCSVLQVSTTKVCYHCGKLHEGKCRFLNAKCHICGKLGHIAPVCKSGKKAPYQKSEKGKKKKSDKREEPKTKWLEAADSGLHELNLFTVGSSKGNQPIQVVVTVNDHPLTMEVDTGAAVSVLPEAVLKSQFQHLQLLPSTTVLKSYTGQSLEVLGEVPVRVKYEQQPLQNLRLVVVRGTGPCLFGRDWLQHIQLDWKQIATVVQSPNTPGALSELLDKYSEVFTDELGTIHPFEAKLAVKEGTRPKFCRARPVPFAMRAAVEEELRRLERVGVLEQVDHSDWATPIVVVPKKNGNVRLCGDYKVTLNPVIDIDQYPLPSAEELFSSLAGGKYFTVLDLSDAYQQIPLSEESRQYLTINTHRGLFRYTRLPFGIASAPAIFQKTMDMMIQGIEGAAGFIDDILITGKTMEEHLKTLEKVLQRFQKHGVRARRVKCKFMRPSVEYLGHRLDAEGVHPLDDKLQAITSAPEPQNVTELRSFLGLLNYYGKFISKLSSIVHPLNALLCKDAPWRWTKDCKAAFSKAKEELVSSQVLVHYDSTLPLVMAGDASAYGVGAVISHITPEGHERPIAFASRTLSSAEKNYSQIEKEALSLLFGVKKFHRYLYGRKFVLETDHKPLTAIFGSKKGVPVIPAARLQRWAIQLSAYHYDIKFRPTLAHANADGLSRLPLQGNDLVGHYSEPGVFNVQQIESLPVTAAQLKNESSKDLELSKVCQFVKDGWPSRVEDNLKPYHKRRDELTVEVGCLLWGTRAVIPRKLRAKLLQELHKDHPGITRMKEISRSYMWWPGLGEAIEELAKSCQACLSVKHSPSVAPLRPWTWPSKPFERVHVDFAGPFQGTMLLILVDAHSKWPEVIPMSSTTVASTIEVLRKIFASHGLPEQLVSDNGPQFTAHEFATFMKGNGVRHIRSAPYHPATNGLAERFVQSVKQALKVSVSDGQSLAQRLSNFLLTYRNTPHATTGVSPSYLFLGRRLRTRLDLLKPDLRSTVLQKQAQQKDNHDSRAKERQWFVGQAVMVRNMRPGPDWIPGVIVERLGPISYLIETNTHQRWKRHVEQIKEVGSPPQVERPPVSSTEFQTSVEWDYPTPGPVPEDQAELGVVTPTDSDTTEASTASTGTGTHTSDSSPRPVPKPRRLPQKQSSGPVPAPRRSARTHQRSDRLGWDD